MSSEARAERVAALIHEEVAKLLTKGVKDPRIGFVSVTHVRMSRDLRYANIYVSLLGEHTEQRRSLAGLQSSSGWMRHEIGKYLHLRFTPELRFFQDESLDKVFALEDMFRQLHENEENE